MTSRIRHAVRLVGTDQYLVSATFYRTRPFELAKLYARKQDAEKLERRWNAKRTSLRYAHVTQNWPEAEVVRVGVVLSPIIDKGKP